MSIVVGLKHKDKVWLACDKQITAGNMKVFLSGSHNKVFPVIDREGIIIGGVGFLRGINLLETNNSYIDELSYLKDEIDYSYMVNAFPILLNKVFMDAGFVSANDEELRLKGAVLVGVYDKLYAVDSDASVMEVGNYVAIGTGEEFAYGSLNSEITKYALLGEEMDDDDIIGILTSAIKAANQSSTCGGGVYILNTLGEEFQFQF